MKTLSLILSTVLALVLTTVLVQACGLTGTDAWLAGLGIVAVSTVITMQLPQGALYLICGGITKGSSADCDYPITAGTDDRLFLINKNDILLVTRDGTNPMLITALTLKTGKKAYLFQGQLGSLRPKWRMVKVGFQRMFEHEATFLDMAPVVENKVSMAAMPKGRYVGIIVQNYAGDALSQSKIEIFGLDVGMEVESMERDYTNSETQSAVEILMKSPEKEKEPRIVATYFATDAATSIADIEALLIAAV